MIMKNTKTRSMLRRSFLLIGALCMVALYSCDKDDPIPDDPIATFQYVQDEENFLVVVFTNYSSNATSYSWNFGDGETSVEENPTHTFAAEGDYDVSLTATNSAGSHTYTQTIEVKDPVGSLGLLAGNDSKTWRLYRVGTSLGVGPDAENARQYWSLDNSGLRPCVYHHEFTFHRDGSFVFDDKGSFWGEEAIFGGTDLVGTCFEATAANMVNSDGVDVSAFLGNTHAFEYEPSTNTIVLNGLGAWMGMPQLGTTGESTVPENSRTFKGVIEEFEGYDLLTISFTYADLYWDATYASYSDPSLEPEVVEEHDPGEDLPSFTPEEMYNTFASTDEADVKYLVPTESLVTITPGVDDPADATAAKVGEYHRGTDMYADLKFQMDFNIQFDNFTTVSLDVYVPSSNTYSEGGLDKSIMIWIADASTTQNFWESWVQFLVEPEDVVEDEWVTYTFQLDTPSEGSVGTALSRTDLDLVGLTIGGGGHDVDGIFYIRNFVFE